MIMLDSNADVFPVGLAETAFGDVYRAISAVASTVWAVDPAVYRAGMAWGWYVLNDPGSLIGFRDVVSAALISAGAPLVKANQTNAELVEYLRAWRVYTPTFGQLENVYGFFGASVDIRAISDPYGQSVLPVADTRLAFYVIVDDMDAARPLTVGEIYAVAVNASPLGSRPVIVLGATGEVITACDVVYGDACIYAEAGAPAVEVEMRYPLCGVVTGTSDDIVLGEIPGNIDNGAITLPVRSLSSNTIPDSGVVEEYKSNVIEMLFGIYYNGSQWTSQHIASYQGWASEILSLEDKQKLIDFGLTLTTYTGPYGTIFRGIGYTFEPIALYSDIDGTVQNEVDMSNFTCAILTNKGDSVGIQTASPSYDYWGWCMSWKCRITKNS